MSKTLWSLVGGASLLWPMVILGVDAAPAVGPAPLINPNSGRVAGDLPSSVLPDRPGATIAPTTNPGDLLGKFYENQSAGIELRPPVNCKFVGRVDGDHIAEWQDETNSWTLKLSRVELTESPRPLTTEKVGNTEIEGLLEITVDNLKRELPKGLIVHQDVSTFGEGVAKDLKKKDPYSKPNLGMVAIRYTEAGKRRLTQQALFQASQYLYYVLTLTTPGNKSTEENPPEDPKERLAVETFGQMVDSVKLLDRVKIRRDQEERLYRTRSFFVNLTGSKLRAALVPEQWFRVLKDGKDVGYTYIVEEKAADIPRPSRHKADEPADKSEIMSKPDVHPGEDILIGIRSRITLDGVRADKTTGPIQTDSETWLFTTADCRHEDWTSAVIVDDGLKNTKKQFVEEFGASDRHMINNGNGVRQGRTLEVQQISNAINAAPISRDLSPWFLPQGIGHLLPRIISPKEPKTYMFAIFVSEAREVMERYIDVGRPDDFMLNGQRIHAIPIMDRIGLEGSVTTHYVSATPDADGRYTSLGSENKTTHITTLATDAPTLQKIWSDVNLSRPRLPERPAGAPQGPPAPTNRPAVSDLPARP